MKRQNVAAMAKANGIAPQTAHNRILKGWSVEAATSTPARKYHRPRAKPKLRYGQKADAVWAYLVANPLARPAEVSKATGVSYGYVYKLMSKVGTPREVFEAEAAAKASVTEDVSLEQFVKDDTSPFPPTKLLVGVIIVAVLVAMVLFG
ncbi:hypothetical protein OAF44_03580 [Akkermansiaceae bacterium]|nr:hypothetical protein [Akkermansiaceae bacterium]